MAMSYTSLIADKNTSGSIKRWINWAVVDVEAVVEEAQALIYQIMRVREMRDETDLPMLEGDAEVALPSNFLDPIYLYAVDALGNKFRVDHHTEEENSRRRVTQSISETVTITIASPAVVSLAAHGLKEGDPVRFETTGTLPTGITTGTIYYVISAGLAADSFRISATRGGTAVNTSVSQAGVHTLKATTLVEDVPDSWAIVGEKIKFSRKWAFPVTIKLIFFKKPDLLSESNTTNFLTNRYPHILRTACLAAAWDFKGDEAESERQKGKLGELILNAAGMDELAFRGVDLPRNRE